MQQREKKTNPALCDEYLVCCTKFDPSSSSSPSSWTRGVGLTHTHTRAILYIYCIKHKLCSLCMRKDAHARSLSMIISFYYVISKKNFPQYNFVALSIKKKREIKNWGCVCVWSKYLISSQANKYFS